MARKKSAKASIEVRELLSSAGWVDKSKGVVHVPIDLAMYLTVLHFQRSRRMPGRRKRLSSSFLREGRSAAASGSPPAAGPPSRCRWPCLPLPPGRDAPFCAPVIRLWFPHRRPAAPAAPAAPELCTRLPDAPPPSCQSRACDSAAAPTAPAPAPALFRRRLRPFRRQRFRPRPNRLRFPQFPRQRFASWRFTPPAIPAVPHPGSRPASGASGCSRPCGSAARSAGCRTARSRSSPANPQPAQPAPAPATETVRSRSCQPGARPACAGQSCAVIFTPSSMTAVTEDTSKTTVPFRRRPNRPRPGLAVMIRWPWRCPSSTCVIRPAAAVLHLHAFCTGSVGPVCWLPRSATLARRAIAGYHALLIRLRCSYL